MRVSEKKTNMKLTKTIIAIFMLLAVQFSNIVAQTPTEIEKSKSDSKAESNIIGNVYQADYSKSKIFYPSDLANTVPKAIVVKGDARTKTLFDSMLLAKEFSKKNKQANVIIFDNRTKKYSLYELIIGENSPVAIQLAETLFRKALNNNPSVPMTYEALKISPDYSLQIIAVKMSWGEVADIVDAEGLSLIKKTNMQLMFGSKGIRLLFDSEIEKSNFDEALKIYQWLEKLNINSNDLDVVKITRKTNLAKMFQYAEKLRPFVEAEMEKWKYAEADKIAVRGTKTQGSQTANPTTVFSATETIKLLRETFGGKFDLMEGKPLGYTYINKKTNERFDYEIQFVEDSGKLAFKWKQKDTKQESEKLLITDNALASATEFVNFLKYKNGSVGDKQITILLSQKQYKELKESKEFTIDLGNGMQRLVSEYLISRPAAPYTNKSFSLYNLKSSDGKTTLEVFDNPVCPLVITVDTPEYFIRLR